MSTFIAVVASFLCVLIYLPGISKGLSAIQERKTMMTRWRLTGIKVTKFSDTAAIIHGLFQILRSMVVIFGAANAILEEDVRIVLWAYLIGWGIGWLGLSLAKRVQVGESEFEFGPTINFGGRMNSPFGGGRNPFGNINFSPDDFVDADAVMSNMHDDGMVIDAQPILPNGDDPPSDADTPPSPYMEEEEK